LNTNNSNIHVPLPLTGDATRRNDAITNGSESVGIDTVRLQARIDRAVRQQLVEPEVTNPWVHVKLPLPGVRLEVNSFYACVQANLPLVAGCATNLSPVDPESAEELTRMALTAALDFAPLTFEAAAVDPEAFTFTRVDVVRDFVGVDELDLILDGLQRQLQVHEIPFHRHTDGGSSLAVKREEWRANLYDKHAESSAAAPPGSVRFELNLKTRRFQSKWAESRGGSWRRPGDITRHSAYRMARDTFVDLLHFGTASRPVSHLLEKVQSISSRPRYQATLIGLAHEPSLLRQFPRTAKSTFRPLVEEIGPLCEQGATAHFLDFDSGLQASAEAVAS
jgi:hypothetical protein